MCNWSGLKCSNIEVETRTLEKDGPTIVKGIYLHLRPGRSKVFTQITQIYFYTQTQTLLL